MRSEIKNGLHRVPFWATPACCAHMTLMTVLTYVALIATPGFAATGQEKPSAPAAEKSSISERPAAVPEAPAKSDGSAATGHSTSSATKSTKSEHSATGTMVEMKTTEGTIKLELADKEAPITVKNFISYINDKFYDGLIFHRVIKDFMIQGGGYSLEGDKLVEKPTKSPITNEAKNGLKNNRGTIAMARTQDPNSATAQFYINHTNNDNLNYPSFDGHGYAVFGKVVDGMDVVDKIAAAKTGVRGGMPDVPLNEIKIITMVVVTPAGH